MTLTRAPHMPRSPRPFPTVAGADLRVGDVIHRLHPDLPQTFEVTSITVNPDGTADAMLMFTLRDGYTDLTMPHTFPVGSRVTVNPNP